MKEADNELAQLQKGIAALEAQRALLGDVVVDAAIGPMRRRLGKLEGQSQSSQQRKQATVLFADVSGFTPLSETMDAEVVAGIMNDLWAAVDQAITDNGGRIDKHIGDAVMALWGTEAAREDDPEMAVRGALAMQAAIDEFCTTHSVPLAMRIGMNTGPVLLGQVGSTAEFTAMGDAVNLASRLEHAAPVGGVLVSHDTYRHVRGIFDVAVQEPLTVKGKAEPVQTYLVQRAKPRSFRMATRGVEGIETRMVGRDHDLGMLQEAYADAVESAETRVVTVIGEAGVGKSRLLYEFDNWIELRPELVTYFKGRGTPNTQNVPYSLFHDLFAFRFDIRDSDSAALALDKFQAGMAPYIHPDQAAVAGQWLGFDFSASEAVIRLLDAEGFAETARAYLMRYFRGVVAEGPVVVLLEDIHWADDISLDLVLHLAATLPAAPLLVVAVARPVFFERRPGWGEGETAFRKITLAPLSRRASRMLVEEILQRVDDLPDALRDLIVDAAEGNPYYVEEMVKMLIDQGVIERVTSGERRLLWSDEMTSEDSPNSSLVTRHSSLETWLVRADRLEGLKVPPTLTGLLQARLDGLPRPEREVLQRASVVGRLFWDDCVAELMETEREAVEPTLQAVRGRELIFRREHSAFAHAGEYIFKHALLRDVAYETVLLKHRAAFHGKVARWLEDHAGERRDEYLGLIAEHYIHAGERLKAAELLELAAHEARQVGTYFAVRQALERALALREANGETAGPAVRRAKILLGEACLWVSDFPAAEKALEHALADARRDGDVDDQSRALVWLTRSAHYVGDHVRSQALLKEALPLARAAGGTILADALGQAGRDAWMMGDPDAAQRFAYEALEVARAADALRSELNSLNLLGIVAGHIGRLEEARSRFQEVLNLAQANGEMARATIALQNLGDDAYRRGDYREAKAYGLAAFEQSRELEQHSTTAMSLVNIALADLKLDNRESARRQAIEGIILARRLGTMPLVLWGIEVLGELAIAEGDVSRALALFGLIRAHPAADHQHVQWIATALESVDLPLAEVETGLATGAALDFDAVVQEILDGEW
jgi:class 3 adenylate cyclase/tetratricopeptide (TPR) repeat protein